MWCTTNAVIKFSKNAKGHGEALQCSLFRCTVTSSEQTGVRAELWPLRNHRAGWLFIIDLGPEEERGRDGREAWVMPWHDSARHDGI